MELETVSRTGSGAENGNGSRTPVTLRQAFRRFVKRNGHGNNPRQITISARISVISRKLVKESRLSHPALPNRSNAEKTADTLHFAFAEFDFLHGFAFDNNVHGIFGQRLIVGVAVFNGRQGFTVLVDDIRRKTGHCGHALLLHQQSAGVRFENRLNVMKHGQFAVNREQRGNHSLVHIIT